MARRRRMRAPVLAGATLLVLALGCATYSERTAAARDSLRSGDLEGGVRAFNKVLKVKDEQLPEDWKGANALAVLERGTIWHAMRRYPASIQDFQVADKQLEFLDIAKDAAGKIGKYIYSDSATKYKTSPTEKLALNAVNMTNYLVRGDLQGAAVEARRFTVMHKYLQDYQPDVAHGAFGSYLAGFVFERQGDANRALRYYDDALQEQDFATLREPIARLAARGSYRGQRIKDYLPAQDPPASPVEGADRGAELLVTVKLGRVPYKEARRIPIGAAVGLASAFIVGDPTILEYGMFKVVVYPELVPAQNLFDQATLSVDGKPLQLELASDLGAEIVHEWEGLKPKIIGAAITRMIVRAAAAEGARAAGRQAQQGGQIIGFLAAAALEGTLVALDRPDTRSWTTLPSLVHIGRARLPAGKHTIEVVTSGPGGRERHTTTVELDEGGFAVVDVTTLR